MKTVKSSRRTLLKRSAAACAAVVAVPALAGGSASASGDAGRAGQAAHGTGTTVMIIRHAEKPADDGSLPYGVEESGEQDKDSLAVRGWQRAGALAELFAPYEGIPRSGLSRPHRIYATSAEHHGRPVSRRPIETVTPLADKLGKTIDTSYDNDDEKKLAKELAGRKGTSLVAWHHGTIPKLARDLTGADGSRLNIPDHWPGHRFDVVWVFEHTKKGWTFRQVPQMLLSGDEDKPIKPSS
ncbi:hypothetical protein KBZ10_02810 [Streptomyces sp. F63]|uniref:hypothetical protein n=1 Tax=Streptomyces sp. F63 TaxID=2824887 RepID=UPI001B387861|nr:hypothetical protein [Streptomyces sp. F63]MBQ0983480.1 hypothetical protein [Streptomyces sp. F63]